MSGLGASLAICSKLPVYAPFYFSSSSMKTGAGFLRTTNNDVPLTISPSSVSTKSMKSIFFVTKEMLRTSIRITGLGFVDACKLLLTCS